MNLSAPKRIVFLIAVILAILAVLSMFVVIPIIAGNAFWAMTAAFVLLAAGNLMSGL